MIKKALISIGVSIGMFLGAIVVAYAITKKFTTKSDSLRIDHKEIFEINLVNDYQETAVAPGDSFNFNAAITNDATEEM